MNGATSEATDWVLYQRDDCHLCDMALAVLAEARLPTFDSVFIDDHDHLPERYGTRVPVLHHKPTGKELNWPFDAAAVQQLMALLTNQPPRATRPSAV